MFGLHVTGTIDCQHYTDELFELLRAGDEGDFAKRCSEILYKLKCDLDVIEAGRIVDSFWRCGVRDPSLWRANVAMTLERVRQGFLVFGDCDGRGNIQD